MVVLRDVGVLHQSKHAVNRRGETQFVTQLHQKKRWNWCVSVCVGALLCARLIRCTGWRRLIGCLKLQVMFRKRATNYRALLQKTTCEDMAPYDPTPPCTSVYTLYTDFVLRLMSCSTKSVRRHRAYWVSPHSS